MVHQSEARDLAVNLVSKPQVRLYVDQDPKDRTADGLRDLFHAARRWMVPAPSIRTDWVEDETGRQAVVGWVHGSRQGIKIKNPALRLPVTINAQRKLKKREKTLAEGRSPHYCATCEAPMDFIDGVHGQVQRVTDSVDFVAGSKMRIVTYCPAGCGFMVSNNESDAQQEVKPLLRHFREKTRA